MPAHRRDRAFRAEVGARALPGGRIDQQPTSGDGVDLGAAVRAGVDEVRYRNGLAVAWLRAGLRLLTLGLWIASALGGAGASYWTAAVVNALHLAVAGAVLLLLRRRIQVGRVLLLAASVDLLVVAIAALRAEVGDVAEVGYLMGVFQFILLLAALTLPRVQVVPLALAAIACQLALGLRTGIATPSLLATVLTLAAFSLAATVAGARMVELAARRALDVVAGEQARAHGAELARANAEIAAQRDQLVAARQQAVTLTQLVVHDLRNPLSSILQFLSLARTRVRDQGGLVDVEEDLRLAGEEGQRLADMVGDLLLLAQLENGAMRTRPQPVPIRPLLDTAARAVGPRAADRRVALSIQGDPDLVARCDLDLVRRLLDNLLVNALRYVRPGDRIELEGDLQGAELRLAVRNSGPPVPEAVRERLFEKHGPGADRQWQNAGLGLYLCRLVAEAHGGRMGLVEEPGWPVVFEARLPGACP